MELSELFLKNNLFFRKSFAIFAVRYSMKYAFKQRKWLVFLGVLLPINLLMSLDRNAFILVSPKINTIFHFSYLQSTILASSMIWIYALAQIPAGWFINRFKPHVVLFVACLAWSLSVFFFPFARNFSDFLLLRCLLGAFQAPDWASSIVLVNDWFPPAQRSLASSFLLSIMYLGSSVSGPIVTTLTTKFGWASPFYSFALIGIVISFLWLRATQDQQNAPVQQNETNYRDILSAKPLWLLATLYFCTTSVQSFFSLSMPHYLMEYLHVSYSQMGWLYAATGLTLYSSVLLSGLLINRHAKTLLSGNHMRLIPACSLPLAGFALLISSYMGSLTLSVLLLCASIFFIGVSQVSIWSLVHDYMKTGKGMVAGFTTFLGNIGAALTPIATAWLLSKNHNWHLSLLIPFFISLIGCFICTKIGRHKTPTPAASGQ